MSTRIPDIGRNVTARWEVPDEWNLPSSGERRRIKGWYQGTWKNKAHVVKQKKDGILRYIPMDAEFTIHRKGEQQ